MPTLPISKSIFYYYWVDEEQRHQLLIETYEPWNVISNNVALWQVQAQRSLCSLLLSLETPNDVR